MKFGKILEGLATMTYVDIFYGYLVYFTAILYMLLPFGIFSPVLVHCTKKILATLMQSPNFSKALVKLGPML
jgi:hypothetical protein